MRAVVVAGLVIMLLCGAVAAQGEQGARSAAAGTCDRACLEGFVDQYLDAWVARDAKRLPLTANVKYTENGSRLDLGDGSWNVTTVKKYRLFIRPADGQLAHTTVTEGGTTPAQNVRDARPSRLKVEPADR
jgi:hypothetical protein